MKMKGKLTRRGNKSWTKSKSFTGNWKLIRKKMTQTKRNKHWSVRMTWLIKSFLTTSCWESSKIGSATCSLSAKRGSKVKRSRARLMESRKRFRNRKRNAREGGLKTLEAKILRIKKRRLQRRWGTGISSRKRPLINRPNPFLAWTQLRNESFADIF